MGRSDPHKLTLTPRAVVVIVHPDRKPDDISRLRVAERGQRNTELRVVPGAIFCRGGSRKPGLSCSEPRIACLGLAIRIVCCNDKLSAAPHHLWIRPGRVAGFKVTIIAIDKNF